MLSVDFIEHIGRPYIQSIGSFMNVVLVEQLCFGISKANNPLVFSSKSCSSLDIGYVVASDITENLETTAVSVMLRTVM